ncbi:heparan-alpha-glucosaminide N-acetyltransferase domain-containing protein [Kocuria sp. CPCC 205263]|uniref:heparan-alpha-glucosaminide N-acetyltransferase domain-containing protein n=1 Tax=Kocuria sp. CPCC 205263 TaxID=3073555 RepID=UPI0034D50575
MTEDHRRSDTARHHSRFGPVGGEKSSAAAPASSGGRGKRDVSRDDRRVVGVDAARGYALFGMTAVHTLDLWNDEVGRATLTGLLFSGKSSALFVTLAGVSLAFVSGGRASSTGRRMVAARWSVAARAVLIAIAGLLTGLLDAAADNILVYYGMFFLLAIPFLGLRIRYLLLSSALFALLGPLLVWWAKTSLPSTDAYEDPTIVDLLTDPLAVASDVLLTGAYPALAWMTYLCAGLALGRMDLRSLRVQVRLVLIGAALTCLAWGSSFVALHVLGGFEAIRRATPWMSSQAIDEIVAVEPDSPTPTTTLWWLVVPGPHTHTPLALLLCLGTAVVTLGLFLLVPRAVTKLLAPLIAMGSMTFTLYTAHLVFLSFDAYETAPLLWFWIQATCFALFAVLWQRTIGQGPLEKAVSTVTRGVRRRVLAHGAARDMSA